MKEISVIVPIYNVEKYLDRCLDSIQKQCFESYEVILVDDGSTDTSRSIAEKYVESDATLFKLVCQENKGLSEARNTGMRHACGKYLCFVDSDDYVEECYLDELYQCALQTNADLVFCAFKSVNEEGETIKAIFESEFKANESYSIEDRKDLLLIQNAAWNKLYKKEIIDEHDLKFTAGVWYEDIRFVKKYMLFASRFAYTDRVLYNYLIRQGSIMNSMASKRNAEIVGALDELVDYYKHEKLYEVYEEELEFLAIDHIYISTLVRLIRAKDREQFAEVKKAFLSRFPKYKKNKYLGRLDRNRKLVFILLNMGWNRMIEVLFNIKEGKR